MNTVSDFISRTKNAKDAGRKKVLFPYSKIGKELGKILISENFFEELKEEKTEKGKILVAKLKYFKRKPIIKGVSVVSKPSLRIYSKAKNVNRTKKGLEIAVISTNQGIMTDKEARKKGIGGEVLLKIW